jgi:outer membrane protein
MKTLLCSLVATLIAITPAVGETTPKHISLDACIKKALKGNPGTRAASLRVEAAQAALQQARSAYYPRLSAEASYSMTDNPPQAFMMELNQKRLDMRAPDFDPNNPSDTENIRLSLALKYRLYDGTRGANTAMAKLGGKMAAFQYQASLNALIHEVTRGYYQVLQAQAFVAVQEQSLKSLQENLRVANQRFEAGSAVKTDVLNLDVQTAQASEELIRARNGIKLAIAALNTAIGEDLIPPEGIAPADNLQLDDVGIKDETNNEYVEKRPEYQMAALMSRVAELTVKKSRRARGPVVNAYGSIDWDGEDMSDQEQSYLAGIALEWEWFTGFQDAARTKQAERDWLAAQQDQEQILNQLKLDMRQATLAAQEAQERLAVMSKSVKSAEEALRITQERYREGSADITTLLISEVGLTATRTRETAAKYDCLVARSNLERARGILIDKYEDTNAEPEE